jgi:hypothetical protein
MRDPQNIFTKDTRDAQKIGIHIVSIQFKP